MAKKTVFSLVHHYRRLEIGIRHWCDNLTIRQRKIILLGVGLFYLICACVMMAQSFLTQEEELPIPKGMWEESSTKIERAITKTPNHP